MKFITLSLVLLILSGLYDHVSAQDYKLAMGLRLSTSPPTLSNSVSIKYFLDETNAVEGLIGWGTRFGLGALYERHQLIGATPSLNWFYGGGGCVGFQDGKTWLGPTGIVGMDYKFPNAPVNLSLDWKPELDILPDINFVPGAFAVSIRYTFGRTPVK
ncbi:hypothetical protein ACQ86N_26580 [Puia sp. P3]|uniref:hypothetical protein n=1 Tax=Puia sp. P3 TaxID=3423952 RepID=UPI003D67442E